MVFTLEISGFECLLCKTTYASKSSYTEHLQTKKHRLNDPNNKEKLLKTF